MTVKHISHPIPYNAFESHIGVIGKTGSGKTHAIRSAIEALLDLDERTCIIDPTGAWWGMKSRYDVVIFGGEHEDLPLGPNHGETIAEVIGSSTTPAIIDTSLMRTKERTRFFADFADGLIRKNKGPLHLVIDEAHVFAPQGKVPDPASGEMLHAANNLVSLGRSRGLRVVLITQRPAKLHKDSLTQVETLIAMRLIAPQDRKAVEEWIKDNADPVQGKEIITSLAKLKTGEGYVWAPELDMLERVTFPRIKSYDSSKAPTGRESDAPKLRKIDVEAIEKRLVSISEEAFSNDPARLRKRIAELERLIDAGPSKQDIDEIVREHVQPYIDRIEQIRKIVQSDTTSMLIPAQIKDAKIVPPDVPFKPSLSKVKNRADIMGTSAGTLRKGALRILAELCARHPAGYSHAQVGALTRFSPNGGTFRTYMSDLRREGVIEERGGLIYASEKGILLMGDSIPAKPTTHQEAMRQWQTALRAGAYRMLEVVVDEGIMGIDRSDLATSVSMEENGGTFRTYLSDLKRNGLIRSSRSRLFANDILFP